MSGARTEKRWQAIRAQCQGICLSVLNANDDLLHASFFLACDQCEDSHGEINGDLNIRRWPQIDSWCSSK